MRRATCLVWLAATSVAVAQPKGPPAPKPPLPTVVISAKAVTIDGRDATSSDLFFEVGDTVVKASAAPMLDAVARALATSTTVVHVEVHTDDTAPDNDRTGAWLQTLSQKRADAIKAALVRRGVPVARLVAQGMGAKRPLDAAETDDARARNRRVVFAPEIEVRPPTAADLPGYLKGVRGTGHLRASIETNLGTLHCRLYDDRTPATVANFVGLATGKKPWMDPKTGAVVKNKPFYDGLTFHRVIPQFMIQGGDPVGNGTGGPGYTFPDEIVDGLVHEPGTLAMANAGPDTNGSQFFIDEVRSPHLDKKFTIFGKCSEIELVGAISAAARDEQNRPKSAVTIKRVVIDYGQ